MGRRCTTQSNDMLVAKYVGSAYDEMHQLYLHLDELLALEASADFERYLGVYSTAPTEHLDGSPLVEGDYFVNSSTGEIWYYTGGTPLWVIYDNDVEGAKEAAEEADAAADRATTAANEAGQYATNAANLANEAAAQAHLSEDSANKAIAAELSATASANDASVSATEAADSAILASNWANQAEDVPVESGNYSAFHWAEKARERANAIAQHGGAFTPTVGTEYPTVPDPTQDAVFTVVFDTVGASYTFTAGDLSGKTCSAGDVMYWDTTHTGWDLIHYSSGVTSVNGKAGATITLNSVDIPHNTTNVGAAITAVETDVATKLEAGDDITFTGNCGFTNPVTVPNPVANTDAVNKQYLDTQFTPIGVASATNLLHNSQFRVAQELDRTGANSALIVSDDDRPFDRWFMKGSDTTSASITASRHWDATDGNTAKLVFANGTNAPWMMYQRIPQDDSQLHRYADHTVGAPAVCHFRCSWKAAIGDHSLVGSALHLVWYDATDKRYLDASEANTTTTPFVIHDKNTGGYTGKDVTINTTIPSIISHDSSHEYCLEFQLQLKRSSPARMEQGTLFITKVQLALGSTVPGFVERNYNTELEECMRYLQYVNHIGIARADDPHGHTDQLALPIQMRGVPTPTRLGNGGEVRTDGTMIGWLDEEYRSKFYDCKSVYFHKNWGTANSAVVGGEYKLDAEFGHNKY